MLCHNITIGFISLNKTHLSFNQIYFCEIDHVVFLLYI